jgi:hypothetical protein
MLETYFGSPKMVAHLRAGPSGQYIDGFAGSLERSGYDPSIAVRYLRAAAHIGHFTVEQGGTLANVDLAAFSYHLRTRQALLRILGSNRRQPVHYFTRSSGC